jgi:hypothetical protein
MRRPDPNVTVPVTITRGRFFYTAAATVPDFDWDHLTKTKYATRRDRVKAEQAVARRVCKWRDKTRRELEKIERREANTDHTTLRPEDCSR